MTPASFRNKYRFLVWSNPEAPDKIYIRSVLLNPHLDMMLDALNVFGLERLRSEWQSVKDTDEGRKVGDYAESMLNHFSIGLERKVSEGDGR
ncbi:MAG: hypothetical protein ACYCTV_04405 [Leptospirales bacterium]